MHLQLLDEDGKTPIDAYVVENHAMPFIFPLLESGEYALDGSKTYWRIVRAPSESADFPT